MNTRKIVSGSMVWSVGILVPVLFHTLLMHAAVQGDGYTYSYHNMVKYFVKLPWPVWLYMIAMAVTGGMLVVSGLKDRNADS